MSKPGDIFVQYINQFDRSSIEALAKFYENSLSVLERLMGWILIRSKPSTYRTSMIYFG